MLDGNLTLWTIYDHPRDFPRHFVVAVDFVTSTSGVVRHPGRWLADSLESARAVIRENDPTADTRLARDPSDDPVIAECWL